MENNNFSVSQINSYLKKKFNMDPKLKNIQVKGELSNYKSYANGHDYFTLKDENSQIKGVLYKGRKRNLEFEPENGMKVIIKGSIEVYEKNGYYQLKANTIKKDGIGDLYIAFEKLKKKLQSEGLFDEEYKKEIPKYPKRIGVITAKTGAAIKDIVITIKRRWPLCEIILFPSLVQGNLAANNIVRQIFVADNEFELDTLIVGRGGGSIEDLWAFNERIVAKAILVLRPLPHDTVTGAGPDIGKETQMRQFLPEQPWIMHFCIPEHEQRRRIFTAKRFQQLQFVQERQGKFLVAVPLYIHGKTGLIILRLQVVSDKFRKTLFKTVNLIAFQSQTGSLTVAPELDQVSGTGVKRIIHVQGLDAAAGPFGHIAADTDQNHRTVVFIYQPGCNNADYTGMPSLLRV